MNKMNGIKTTEMLLFLREILICMVLRDMIIEDNGTWWFSSMFFFATSHQRQHRKRLANFVCTEAHRMDESINGKSGFCLSRCHRQYFMSVLCRKWVSYRQTNFREWKLFWLSQFKIPFESLDNWDILSCHCFHHLSTEEGTTTLFSAKVFLISSLL